MRWIKCLGIVGVGGLVVGLLPDLKAHSQKAPQVRSQTKPSAQATRQRPRLKPQARTKEQKPKHVRTPKVARPITPITVHANARIGRIKKIRKKGKNVKMIQVACRMILLISGMT